MSILTFLEMIRSVLKTKKLVKKITRFLLIVGLALAEISILFLQFLCFNLTLISICEIIHIINVNKYC